VRTLAFLAPLLCLAASACSRAPIGCIVASTEISVLEQPYPDGYPSSNPIPNSKVLTLGSGECIAVHSLSYGKDFLAYGVRSKDGTPGYIIHDSGAEYVKGMCPAGCSEVR
jgi:hypothetical protein